MIKTNVTPGLNASCPFCGSGSAGTFVGVTSVQAYCLRCIARGPVADDERSAYERWNNRSSDLDSTLTPAQSDAPPAEQPTQAAPDLSETYWHIYAAHAMTAMIPQWEGRFDNEMKSGIWSAKEIAEQAFYFADAMVAEATKRRARTQS